MAEDGALVTRSSDQRRAREDSLYIPIDAIVARPRRRAQAGRFWKTASTRGAVPKRPPRRSPFGMGFM